MVTAVCHNCYKTFEKYVHILFISILSGSHNIYKLDIFLRYFFSISHIFSSYFLANFWGNKIVRKYIFHIFLYRFRLLFRIFSVYFTISSLFLKRSKTYRLKIYFFAIFFLFLIYFCTIFHLFF